MKLRLKQSKFKKLSRESRRMCIDEFNKIAFLSAYQLAKNS